MTPAVERVVRCPLRLPSVGESAELLAAGWTPVRVGYWRDDTAGDGVWWWLRALELARRDAARRAA